MSVIETEACGKFSKTENPYRDFNGKLFVNFGNNNLFDLVAIKITDKKS